MGTTPPAEGQEISNPSLANALLSKTEFKQEEWEMFDVHDLRIFNFVKSGDAFFKPGATADTKHVADEIISLE